ETQLAKDGRGVEVDALADDPLPIEEEEGDHPTGERPAGGRDAAERSPMGAQEVEFHDHGVVGVMDGVDGVPLVGEGRARGGVVAADGALAVEHLARRDQLVAWMREGAERHVELVTVLGLHVLAHDGFASLAEGRRRGTRHRSPPDRAGASRLHSPARVASGTAWCLSRRAVRMPSRSVTGTRPPAPSGPPSSRCWTSSWARSAGGPWIRPASHQGKARSTSAAAAATPRSSSAGGSGRGARWWASTCRRP